MATKESILQRTVKKGDCLEWSSHVNKSGYGSIWHNGKNRDVHRVSYELNIGEIPVGAHVMHKCDNRVCINPEHLIAGTRRENMMDMFSKNRHRVVSGTRHHNAKLTPAMADEIRKKFVKFSRINGSSALARKFCVTQQAIHTLLRGETWKNN